MEEKTKLRVETAVAEAVEDSQHRYHAQLEQLRSELSDKFATERERLVAEVSDLPHVAITNSFRSSPSQCNWSELVAPLRPCPNTLGLLRCTPGSDTC